MISMNPVLLDPLAFRSRILTKPETIYKAYSYAIKQSRCSNKCVSYIRVHDGSRLGSGVFSRINCTGRKYFK